MRRAAWVLMAVMLSHSPAWPAEDQGSSVMRIYKPAGHVMYRDGWLTNAGDEVAMRCEITEPFYRYLGDLPPGGKVDVSFLKTRFRLQYLTPVGLSKWRRVKETITPELAWTIPEIGLDIRCELKGLTLSVAVQTLKPVTNMAIEVLPEIPVKISNDRVRYAQPPVSVAGQSVIFGAKASFPLLLLQERAVYSVPIQVSFEYQHIRYEKVLFYTFAKEELRW